MKSSRIWLGRLMFYSLCFLMGYGLSKLVLFFKLDQENLEQLFESSAFLLGFAQTLMLLLIKSWAEVKIDEVFSDKVKVKIKANAIKRRGLVYIRLATGIFFSFVLKIASSYLIDSSKNFSIVMSTVGFGSFILVGLCTAFSIVDLFRYHQIVDKLDAEVERQKRRESLLKELSEH